MSERTEIENALFRWAWAYDECDLEGFIDALTEDASVKVEVAGGSVVGPMNGHAAIREFFGGRLAIRTERRRHVTTNVIIDEETADEARTRSYLTLIQFADGKPNVVSTGWYRDLLVKRDGIWKIKDRHAFLEVSELPSP
jgi:3-phenylpropionate/cinnamic acid dioxygenase small subunit